jgi:hypothetical protein
MPSLANRAPIIACHGFVVTRRGGNGHWQNRTSSRPTAASALRSLTLTSTPSSRRTDGTILVGENTFDADMMDAANQIWAMKRIEPYI